MRILASFRVRLYHSNMTTPLDGETTETLIATAAAHDYTVTETQLVRWHREGLLPPIGQPLARRFLGRGRGSETLYPAGTSAQLLALCGLHAHERRLVPLGWSLWWQGYVVSPTLIREALQHLADNWSHAVWQVRNEGVPDAPRRTRIDQPPLRAARDRTGRKGFLIFRDLMVQIMTGTVGEWTDEEREAFERAMGLDRARTDHIGDVEPWYQGDTVVDAQVLASAVAPHRLRASVSNTSAETFATARGELRDFFTLLDDVRHVAELLAGQGAFGLGAAPRLDALTDDDWMAFFLLWLSFRQLPGFAEGCRKIITAMTPFAQLRQQIDAIPADRLGPLREMFMMQASGNPQEEEGVAKHDE